MRRWGLAIVLAAAIAAGSAGAAQDARRVTYGYATGNADFFYSIDYGSHPDATFNGTYDAHLRYFIRTLVAFDGRRISTIERPLVDGYGVVVNKMTVWTGEARTPVQCAAKPSHDTNGARRSSGAHLSVGGGRAHIDPGSAIKWAVGCAATESLAIHGLPDGKTISGGASVRGLNGSIACSDQYRHGAEPGDVNGHTFYGSASFSLKFSSIASGKLADARRALRRQVGRDIPWRRPARYGNCLDTR